MVGEYCSITPSTRTRRHRRCRRCIRHSRNAAFTGILTRQKNWSATLSSEACELIFLHPRTTE
jgi:hypothetical protein